MWRLTRLWGLWTSWRSFLPYQCSSMTSCDVFHCRSCSRRVFREARLQSLFWRRPPSGLPSSSCFDQCSYQLPRTKDRTQIDWWRLHCVWSWLGLPVPKAHLQLLSECFQSHGGSFRSNGLRIVDVWLEVNRPKLCLWIWCRFFWGKLLLEWRKILVPNPKPWLYRCFQLQVFPKVPWHSCSRFLRKFWTKSCRPKHVHDEKPKVLECKGFCCGFWIKYRIWYPKLCKLWLCKFIWVLLKGNWIHLLLLSKGVRCWSSNFLGNSCYFCWRNSSSWGKFIVFLRCLLFWGSRGKCSRELLSSWPIRKLVWLFHRVQLM